EGACPSRMGAGISEGSVRVPRVCGRDVPWAISLHLAWPTEAPGRHPRPAALGDAEGKLTLRARLPSGPGGRDATAPSTRPGRDSLSGATGWTRWARAPRRVRGNRRDRPRHPELRL